MWNVRLFATCEPTCESVWPPFKIMRQVFDFSIYNFFPFLLFFIRLRSSRVFISYTSCVTRAQPSHSTFLEISIPACSLRCFIFWKRGITAAMLQRTPQQKYVSGTGAVVMATRFTTWVKRQTSQETPRRKSEVWSSRLPVLWFVSSRVVTGNSYPCYYKPCVMNW